MIFHLNFKIVKIEKIYANFFPEKVINLDQKKYLLSYGFRIKDKFLFLNKQLFEHNFDFPFNKHRF